MRICNNISFEEIKPFEISASYVELDMNSPENDFNHHTHDVCEIYFNLSGDVSFMVENTIYPIKKGDMIITRPLEYHHCIYRSDKPHNLFWILFSSKDNEKLLPAFFERNIGEKNLVSFPKPIYEKALAICTELVEAENNDFKKQIKFLELIDLINNGDNLPNNSDFLSKDIKKCIDYINDNLSESISVTTLAKFSGMSVNTLERHFKKVLNVSPHSYIQNQRLSNAALLLKSGSSVAEACEKSGFPDYSHFISLFKKRYGKTPFQYKKSI